MPGRLSSSAAGPHPCTWKTCQLVLQASCRAVHGGPSGSGVWGPTFLVLTHIVHRALRERMRPFGMVFFLYKNVVDLLNKESRAKRNLAAEIAVLNPIFLLRI